MLDTVLDTMLGNVLDTYLDKQQQQLLSAICSMRADDRFDEQGLAIYQSNFKASAIRALSISYPSIYALLEEDNFATAVAVYLMQEAKTSADWGEFGHNFPEFLAAQIALNDLPFIGDLAKLDLAFYQAERDSDKTLDLSTLTLLADADPYQLYIDLAPGAKLLSSQYAIARIREMLVNESSNGDENSETDTAELLKEHQSYTVSFRQAFKGQIVEISKPEYQWLEAILNQQSLGQCLDKVAETAFDFQQWLTSAIETQLLVGLRRHNEQI